MSDTLQVLPLVKDIVVHVATSDPTSPRAAFLCRSPMLRVSTGMCVCMKDLQRSVQKAALSKKSPLPPSTEAAAFEAARRRRWRDAALMGGGRQCLVYSR